MRLVTVRLLPAAREKILAFAEEVTTEIGGLMSLTREGRTLTVTDAWVVPQEVSGASVDFDDLVFEDHIKAMGWPNGRPMPHICMGIWHSHASFPVGMSGTDENDMVRKYAMRGYLVNIVVNRKGDWFCQVDSMVGPESGMPDDYTLVTVPSSLVHVRTENTDLLAYVKREIAEKVRTKAQIQVKQPGLFHQNLEEDWEKFYREWQRDDGRAKYERNRDRDRDIPPSSFFGKQKKAKKSLLGEKGEWYRDPKNRRLVFKNSEGRITKSIAADGRGEVTYYDATGAAMIVTNNRTSNLPK